jgi:hypothetical protein
MVDGEAGNRWVPGWLGVDAVRSKANQWKLSLATAAVAAGYQQSTVGDRVVKQ